MPPTTLKRCLGAAANRGSFGANMATVGNRIKQRRLELGLSQRELADDGVTYAYISRLEADTRTPSIKVLRTLAPKLGVSVHWLETGEPDPAEELARLVLNQRSAPLPARARTLARAILQPTNRTNAPRPRKVSRKPVSRPKTPE